MSLLDNLSLAYETLADDPIEQGIHYGHSILEALSAKLVPHLPEPALETATAFSYQVERQAAVRSGISQKTVQGESNQPSFRISSSMTGRLRQHQPSYTPRVVQNRSSQSYVRRSLVGTI